MVHRSVAAKGAIHLLNPLTPSHGRNATANAIDETIARYSRIIVGSSVNSETGATNHASPKALGAEKNGAGIAIECWPR